MTCVIRLSSYALKVTIRIKDVMCKSNRSRTFFLSAFSLAFVISVPSYSVELSNNESFNDLLELSLEDLMNMKVTVASLFEESALDVASSVSVITQEDWNGRGSRRLGKVLEAVPSIHSTTTWGGTETIAIRGYATELSVRGVAFSLDDVPLNSYVYAAVYDKPIIELDFIDRIEMIRGPGSALYGTDAFHGVVSYKLDQQQGNYLKTRTSLGDPLYNQASITSGYKTNNTQINFGLATRKEDHHDLSFDYTDPITGDMHQGSRDQSYENHSAYLTINHGDLDQGKFSFKAFTNNMNASEFQGIGTQFFQALPNSFDIESTSLAAEGDLTGNDSDFALTSLSYEQNTVNDVIVKAQVYYWESHQEWDYDSTNYPQSLTTLSGFTLPCKSSQDSPNPNPIYCPHTIYKSADEDRLGGSIHIKQKAKSINTQWVVGSGYDRQSVNDSRVERIDTSGFTSQFYDNPYQGDSRNIKHLFFQAKTGFFNDRLNLVYGLRWDDYSDVGSHTSPRLSTIYKLSDQWSTKLMYGHAFRAPTAIESQGSGTTIIANNNIAPEIIDTYEWSLNHSTKHHQTEFVIFASEWDDAIALVPSGQGTSNIYQNVNENKSWGLELTHNHYFDQLHVTFNSSYVQNENTTDSVDYEAFPTLMANLGLSYSFSAIPAKIALWQRAMWNYTQADPTANFEPEDARDYYRTDLHYEHQVKQSITLFSDISNLLDRDNTLPSYYGSEEGLPDYSRQISLGIEVKWL